MSTKTDSDKESKSDQQQQTPCDCPVCGGQCQRCNRMGCGMCPYCTSTRCPLCPQCAKTLESFNASEEQQTNTKIPFNLTFERIVLLLILAGVCYIAWKHYKE